jgi:hypothetical protein
MKFLICSSSHIKTLINFLPATEFGWWRKSPDRSLQIINNQSHKRRIIRYVTSPENEEKHKILSLYLSFCVVIVIF